MEAERLIALEAENKRLRETLAPFAEYAEAIPDNWKESQALTITLDIPNPVMINGYRMLDITVGAGAFRNAKQTLAQPTVTTGLLDLVIGAIKGCSCEDFFNFHMGIPCALCKAIEALPPDVREMMEGLR